MPDISLLQREYDVVEEESRLPGLVLTASVTLFIIVAGAWASLYLFDKFYVQQALEIKKKIEDLSIKEAGEALDKLKIFSNKAEVLSGLRGAHTSASALFQKVEKSTHPLISFDSGSLKAADGSVELKGLAPSALILSRQVEIYTEDKNLSEFKVSGIGYGTEHSVLFSASLKFK